MSTHRNIRFCGRHWKVEVWRRPRKYTRLFKTLAEAIAARDAFEAANPPGRAGMKPSGLPWRNTSAERVAAGLCKNCGVKKKCWQQDCEDCRRIKRIKRAKA
jgi:hypothetical protein